MATSSASDPMWTFDLAPAIVASAGLGSRSSVRPQCLPLQLVAIEGQPPIRNDP